jgi:hypothetical protein
MRFLLYHWKATLASTVLFVAGLAIGFGFGGGSRRDITTTRLVSRVLRGSRVPIRITHKRLVSSGRIEFFVARASC